MGFWFVVSKNRTIILLLFSAVLYCIYEACLPSQNCRLRLYGCVDGWPLTCIPIFYPLMLLYSILLCAERCGLIAHWAKLVFLHVGDRSELGANVKACGFLNGITMADKLRLGDFNGAVKGDSEQTLFNMDAREIFQSCSVFFSLHP